MIDGEVSSDAEKVMGAWTNHFKRLSASHVEDFPTLQTFSTLLEDVAQCSWENDEEEMILDVPSMLDEVMRVVGGLKLGKAGGYDDLQPEHLRCGGNSSLLRNGSSRYLMLLLSLKLCLMPLNWVVCVQSLRI